MTRASEAERSATVDIEPEPVTDAEREFLMPIVKYLEVLLEWAREREKAAPSSQPVSGGYSQDWRPISRPRRKNRPRRP